jgi:hypothetical protein
MIDFGSYGHALIEWCLVSLLAKAGINDKNEQILSSGELRSGRVFGRRLKDVLPNDPDVSARSH